MSPSRSRKPVARLRPRSEVFVAVAVAAGIVLGTLLLIWLLRPGTAGDDSTGGLMTRQSRVWLLVVLAVAAAAALVAWLLRGRRRPKKLAARVSVPVALVAVAAGAVVAGIFWPGGLVHHWPPQPNFDTQTPETTPPPVTSPPATTRPSATTVGSTVKTTSTTGGQ